MLRYVCSLPNPGNGGVPHEMFYSDDEVGHARAEQFAQRENKPGRGIYDCIAALADGTKSRRKETVVELDRVIADLDLKNIVEPREEVLQCLKELLLPPSEIRDSGFGLHAVWHLKEPVSDDAWLAQAEDIMKRLAGLLAGDPAPTHRAALLRRPGTTNSKNGEARQCCVIEASGQQYDVTEFDAMFDLYGDQAKLTARQKESTEANGNNGEPKGPIDIDARLAAMQYKGAGDSSINVTRLDVSAAMLARGIGVEETARIILDATRRCVANEPKCKNWRWLATDPGREKSEEFYIWDRCISFIAKHPDRLGDRLPDRLRRQMDAILAAGNQPKLSRNKFGWYLRGYGQSDEAPQDTADTGATTKREIIRRLLLKGTTLAEVLKAVGWKCISLPQQARMLGLTLTKYEENGITKYKATTEGTEQPGKAEQQKRPKPELFVLRPFEPFDPATLPPRQWLYGKHYLRQTVSATVAPGGYGKSTLDMVEGIAMATARNLLGEQPGERLRTWLHNGEETTTEMHRRVAAICKHYNIPQQELVGWFFMTSGNEVPLRVAEGYTKLEINAALIARISDQIKQNQIDVAIFDPLITLHGVPETDNTKMDHVIRIFAGIADDNNCAIELSHHVRKGASGSNGDYGAADIRGATAIHDAIRGARMLNHMSEQDAKDLAIEPHQRPQYFRIDRAKGNYSPASKAVWRQFVNVEIENGDDVGVLVAWDFPGQGEPTPQRQEQDQKADFVFLQLLDRYTLEGRIISDRGGSNYAPAKFAKESEAKFANLGSTALAQAMRRLFQDKKIKAVDEGTGGKTKHKLVRA